MRYDESGYYEEDVYPAESPGQPIAPEVINDDSQNSYSTQPIDIGTITVADWSCATLVSKV